MSAIKIEPTGRILPTGSKEMRAYTPGRESEPFIFDLPEDGVGSYKAIKSAEAKQRLGHLILAAADYLFDNDSLPE